MTSTDPRIDAYIDRQQDFAKPILMHIRAAVHQACPEVDETLKWSMPAFTYKGRILCGMSAFKHHAALSFWNGEEIVESKSADSGMGQFGRLTSVADLPPETELAAMVRKGAALIDAGVKSPRAVNAVRPEPAMPADLAAALKASPAAQTTFDNLAPSARREYLEWVLDAKREETRAKRVATTVAQLADGKKLHWKYEKC